MTDGRPQAEPTNRTTQAASFDSVLASPALPQYARGAKRYKVDIACDLCRRRKVKCDGARPVCGNCQKREASRTTCRYSHSSNDEALQSGTSATPTSVPSQPLRRPHHNAPGRRTEHSGDQVSPLAGQQTILTPSSTAGLPPSQSTPQVADRSCDDLHEYSGGGSIRAFTERIKAAVDAKLGLPPGERPILVPNTDAPVFLSPAWESGSAAALTLDQPDHVLPTRKHADQLMTTYWTGMHPINPFLDGNHFRAKYDALFAGTLADSEERIFLGTFNAVLALSTQYQEHQDREQRQQAGLTYFKRAWDMVRPAQAIWEPPSVDLVECLLLLGNYLQCTNKPHHTWMVLGSAIRIAQSIGLHVPQNYPGDGPEARRRRRVWYACIFLDKQNSISSGRPAAIHHDLIYLALDHHKSYSQRHDLTTDCPASDIDFFVNTLEFYTIVYRVLHTPSSSPAHRSSRSASSILHHQGCDQGQDYLQMALKLDEFIGNWIKRLEESLKRGFDDDTNQERLVTCFRVRILHARIILFRPILAKYCIAPCPSALDPTTNFSLRQRVIHDCARVCIKDAQEIIAILHELQGRGPGGETILPWWHRLFNMHVAATVLIAATLRSDISTQLGVSDSWDRLICLLRAHEHLSAFIPQHIEALQTLAFEVLQTRPEDYWGRSLAAEESESTTFQELLRDDVYSASVPFGLEDIFYLNNF